MSKNTNNAEVDSYRKPNKCSKINSKKSNGIKMIVIITPQIKNVFIVLFNCVPPV